MYKNENKFQNRYRITTARATWHDYNGGNYFVTICTKGREHHFGEIMSVNDVNCNWQRPLDVRDVVGTFHETSLQGGNRITQMHLSPIGIYTDEQLRNIHHHYSYANVPLWVVMPNHIHAIVVIDHHNIPYEKRNVKPQTKCEIFTDQGDIVETFHETSLQGHNPIQIATKMQSWLSVVIRQFKQSVTRFAKQNHIPFAWQSRFHDHIIRNTEELNNLAYYIENNVMNWELDRFNER